MILVITGTHEQQFDRLMRAVESLPSGEEIVVQTGHCTVTPANARAHGFLPFEEVMRLMREARVVVTHAGTGTVMSALEAGKTPVVAARLKKYGEHVDDHQLDLVQSLADIGLIVPFNDGDNLAAKISEAAGRTGQRAIQPADELVAFLHAAVHGG